MPLSPKKRIKNGYGTTVLRDKMLCGSFCPTFSAYQLSFQQDKEYEKIIITASLVYSKALFLLRKQQGYFRLRKFISTPPEYNG